MLNINRYEKLRGTDYEEIQNIKEYKILSKKYLKYKDIQNIKRYEMNVHKSCY